jgi:hypothetical protein
MAALLVGGVLALGLYLTDDRERLEAATAAARERSRILELDIEDYSGRVVEQEEALERDVATGPDCLAMAEAGLAFLQEGERWVGYKVEGDVAASIESDRKLGELAKQIAPGLRPCYWRVKVIGP